MFLGAAVWFALELRRNHRTRRVQRLPVIAPVAATTAVAAPAVAAAAAPLVDGAPTGAVAVQLAALVEAIDRLVTRLGDVAVPIGPAPVPSQSPSPAPSTRDEPVPANPAPMFYAPAANRGPGEAFDPYDWPTQEQLDQFAARRRAPQADL